LPWVPGTPDDKGEKIESLRRQTTATSWTKLRMVGKSRVCIQHEVRDEESTRHELYADSMMQHPSKLTWKMDTQRCSQSPGSEWTGQAERHSTAEWMEGGQENSLQQGSENLHTDNLRSRG
jgi:hypothetical protein